MGAITGNVAIAVRWTKREIAALCSTLRTFLLLSRPLDGSLDAFNVAFTRLLAERRLAIVLAGLRDNRAIPVRRVAEYEKSIAHWRTHPEVYGKSTPEFIARFELLAAAEMKRAEWLAKLTAKVTSGGLPAEVETFDPRDRRTP